MAAERVTICTQQIEERPHQETCLIESTRGNHNWKSALDKAGKTLQRLYDGDFVGKKETYVIVF